MMETFRGNFYSGFFIANIILLLFYLKFNCTVRDQRRGYTSPERTWDQKPRTRGWDTPLQKGPGTQKLERIRDQRLGYPLPREGTWDQRLGYTPPERTWDTEAGKGHGTRDWGSLPRWTDKQTENNLSSYFMYGQ